MEVSVFTSCFTDHMDMDDLSFNHNLQIVNSLEGIFEPSLVLTACENTYQKETINHNIDTGSTKFVQNEHHNAIIKHDEPNNVKNNNDYKSSFNNFVDNNNNNHALTSRDYVSSNMLSFGNPSNCNNFPSNEVIVSQASIDKQSQFYLNDEASQVPKQSKRAFASLSSQEAKDHILTERKRREKMNQRFIALSAIIPGLKKMDKASVLGDAIKYVKQLQEQVKTLEEETKRKTIESAVFVRRCRVFEDDDQDSSIHDELSSGTLDFSYPEIEVKFSNKDVLIRIQCEKKNGVVEKLISHIENDLHLVVINSSSFIFGCSSLDATIIAQMSAEFSMKAKDLVRHLHAALKHREDIC